MEKEIQKEINKLTSLFEQNRNTENGHAMSKYMKGRFPFFGIKAGPRRDIFKDWKKTLPEDYSFKWGLILALWELNEREYQHTAIDLMNSWPMKSIRLEDGQYLEHLITHKSWWDTVDSISSIFLSRYIQKYPKEGLRLIKKWRHSDNFWLNRSCLIFQLKFANSTDFELLKSLIIQFKSNKEFFIQKAIGWALRQYSKFNPEAVRQFVDEQNFKGVAYREASKYI